jgi:D-alanyl-D-alanine carboxypeptidase
LAKNSQAKQFSEVCAFLKEMNKNCVRLNLRSSFFDSPHGLMNPISRSTAFDVAKLSAVCLKDQRFRTIVNTKFYKVLKKG